MADDRAAQSEGLDRAEGSRRLKSRGSGARIRCRSQPARNPAHLELLEHWMRSYQPEKLFDEAGRLLPELQALAPEGERRMGANPHTNGGVLKRELKLPDFHDYAVDVPSPGGAEAEATRVLGQFLRDVVRDNAEARNFRIVGPDETASNRLDAVSRSPSGSGWRDRELPTFHLARTAGDGVLTNISARAGWKAICSPTARFFPATRPSHIVIPCSTSMPMAEGFARAAWRRPIAR